MNEIKARFLIEQLNPVIKKSKHFLCRLDIDQDNEDIILMNTFNAIFYRLHYPDLDMVNALFSISECLMWR